MIRTGQRRSGRRGTLNRGLVMCLLRFLRLLWIDLSAIMAKDRLSRLATHYSITNSRFRMEDVDPGDTLGLNMKEQAGELLKIGIERLAELQERMYAQDRWALLLVFQALDAAGKDGTIKHVMSGINPQ